IEFYTDKPDNELKVLLDALLSKKKRLDVNSPLLPDGALRKVKKRIELEKPKYEREAKEIPEKKLSVFEKYLTLWVLLCIGAGIVLGKAAPEVAVKLDSLAVYEVSIPIAICLFFMMYPIMVKIDFAEVIKAGKTPKPVILTLVINWCIKPFTMYAIATFFLGYVFKDFLPGTEIIKDGSTVGLYRSYISGTILLGIAPCTAMVLMWGYLARGNDGLTLVMVAINSLTMLVLYAPLGGFLLKVNKMPIPWETIALSVLIYVALPLVAGYFSRKWLIKTKGLVWFQDKFLHFLTPVSITALLATLVLLFSFKGDVIMTQKQVILFIAIPLFIQTCLIFAISYALARFLRLGYRDAAPAAMIGASNHFEVAIATSTMLFGLSSGASLATVVGVLIEVPVMLMLVKICLKTQNWFR
ncbi:MAG: arsenite transporter, partial [Planctomycetota bacterium]|nr:arsenite transporter [Planctomycetota bacterium]